MVPVLIVLAVFLSLAAVSYLVAVRGKGQGATRALYSQSRGASAAINSFAAIISLGLGVAIPLIILTSAHSNARAYVGGVKLTKAERSGRELFGEHCGVCHTMAGPNTVGKVGPNLDVLDKYLQSKGGSLTAATVQHTIEYGCLSDPGKSYANQNCLGFGTMPANLVQGKDVQKVADYVAAVAGKSK